MKKKFLLFTMLLFILTACSTITERKPILGGRNELITYYKNNVCSTTYRKNNMTYRIFSAGSWGGIYVVNETLDSLNYLKLIK